MKKRNAGRDDQLATRGSPGCRQAPGVPSPYRSFTLPRGYANRVAVSEGRTARQVLLAQLALLEAKLGEVLDAIAKGDSDRLLAHGGFLEDRFGRPEVELR
jgi:hypothetical protein